MIDYEKKMDERTAYIAEKLQSIKRINWFGYGFVVGVMLVSATLSIIYYFIG